MIRFVGGWKGYCEASCYWTIRRRRGWWDGFSLSLALTAVRYHPPVSCIATVWKLKPVPMLFLSLSVSQPSLCCSFSSSPHVKVRENGNLRIR